MMLPDGDRIADLLDAGAAAYRLPAALPIWCTEYGYQTNPPDPDPRHRARAAGRVALEAERITWRRTRVVAQTQFLLRDDDAAHPLRPERPAPLEQLPDRPALRRTAQAKPALDAYRLPLHAPDRVPRARDQALGHGAPGRRGR